MATLNSITTESRVIDLYYQGRLEESFELILATPALIAEIKADHLSPYDLLERIIDRRVVH